MNEPIEPAQTKHNIFEDPAIAASLREDPVLRFLKNNWRQIGVTVLAVVAILVAKDRFVSTRNASLDEAGRIYSSVSSELEAYRTLLKDIEAKEKAAPTDQTKREEYDKSLSELRVRRDAQSALIAERLTALADQREPYSETTALYRGLLSVAQGKDPGALTFSEEWETKAGAERFIAETGALARARLLLDGNDPKQGRAILIALAEKGQYASVPAASSLAHASSDSAEKAEARAVLEKIVTAQPYQQELLSADLDRLK